MNLIKNTESLNEIIRNYFVKNTLTNNYILLDAYSQYISEKRLYSVLAASNACILLEKAGFNQLYYYINDQHELLSIPGGNPTVMEILYRGEAQRPHNILDYWRSCGFRQHLTRDTMVVTLNQVQLPGEISENIKISQAESDEEIIFSQELIEKTFDKYTGDILTLEEVKLLADNKNIFCAYLDGELCGVLQFEIKNNVVWLGHIAVSSGFRGKGIANELVKTYIINNASQPNTRYQLWVVQDNKAAIALYQKFGYVYGNKSSASMLKN